MAKTIAPIEWSTQDNQWLLAITMDDGYVQRILSPAWIALDNYRKYFMEYHKMTK